MSNKIIKLSIILIFMLFVTGLFNFCFAFSVSSDIELSTTVTSYLSDGNTCEIPLYNSTVSYIECPTDHLYKVYIYSTLYNEMRCYVSNNPLVFSCSINNWRIYLYELDENGNMISPTNTERYVYNFNTNAWSYKDSGSSVSYTNMNLDSNYLFIDYTEPVLYGLVTADSTELIQMYPEAVSSIDMKVVQTGTRTGHVEFTPVNWDSHMYYIKDDMDELVRLIAEEELSVTHEKVKLYSGPVSIEYGEYVMGLLFDDNGDICFSEISDTVTIDYDSLLDTDHKLYIDKENENIYYLSIHNYQEGDYLKVSDVSISNDAFSSHCKVLDNLSTSLDYNGLFIGTAYDTALGHKNRKINLSKNGITYFYLYDKDNNLINSAVINSSNYYSGEEFNFDVELSYGNNKFDTDRDGLLSYLNDYFNIVSATEILTNYNNTAWVKVKPIINVPSIDNYELYIRINDYGTLEYLGEEDRNIFASHDNILSNFIGVGLGTGSNINWHRIDDKIYDYFYLATLQDTDAIFVFELQLRSGSGQIIETKSFKINLSASNKDQGTISSSTNGVSDTIVRNPNELSGIVSGSNKFDFSGLNDLSEEDLKNNVEGLIDNSIGFFGLFSTIFLLLPTWISSLIYLFFFGLIVITLLRFLRGS